MDSQVLANKQPKKQTEMARESSYHHPGVRRGCDLPLLEPAQRQVRPGHQVAEGKEVNDPPEGVDVVKHFGCFKRSPT